MEKEIIELLKNYNLKLYYRKIDTVFLWDNHRNKYEIIITNLKTKKTSVFYFFGSYYDFLNKTKPKVNDIMFCLINDSLNADYEIDDFFSEFGYEKPSEALKALKECKETNLKLQKLFNSYTDFITFQESVSKLE